MFSLFRLTGLLCLLSVVILPTFPALTFAEPLSSRHAARNADSIKVESFACEVDTPCKIAIPKNKLELQRDTQSVKTSILFGEDLLSQEDLERGLDKLLELGPLSISKTPVEQDGQKLYEIKLSSKTHHAFASRSGEVFLVKAKQKAQLLTLVSGKAIREGNIAGISQIKRSVLGFQLVSQESKKEFRVLLQTPKSWALGNALSKVSIGFELVNAKGDTRLSPLIALVSPKEKEIKKTKKGKSFRRAPLLSCLELYTSGRMSTTDLLRCAPRTPSWGTVSQCPANSDVSIFFEDECECNSGYAPSIDGTCKKELECPQKMIYNVDSDTCINPCPGGLQAPEASTPKVDSNGLIVLGAGGSIQCECAKDYSWNPQSQICERSQYVCSLGERIGYNSCQCPADTHYEWSTLTNKPTCVANKSCPAPSSTPIASPSAYPSASGTPSSYTVTQGCTVNTNQGRWGATLAQGINPPDQTLEESNYEIAAEQVPGPFGELGAGGDVGPAGPEAPAPADSATLAWDPNPETDVIGYKVHYGTTSGVYTNIVDAKNVTQISINGLEPGKTYFAMVTAYNSVGLESLPSAEISFENPISPPIVQDDKEKQLVDAIRTAQKGLTISVNGDNFIYDTRGFEANLRRALGLPALKVGEESTEFTLQLETSTNFSNWTPLTFVGYTSNGLQIFKIGSTKSRFWRMKVTMR